MVSTIQTDRGVGSPPGRDGKDGVGIALIEQIDNARFRITLTNRAIYTFTLPRGAPGLDGVDGRNPVIASGQIFFRAYGTPPQIQIAPTNIEDVFTVNLFLPDPSISADRAYASEQAAAASKTAAAGSATAAATSAGQAAQKVTDATAQVGFATAQAVVATNAAADAIASYDSFDDRYLGPKAADPTLDNDGNALLIGALYYNTGAQPGMRVRTAAGTWDKGYAVITGGVQSFKNRDGAVVPMAGDYTATQIAGLATRSLFVSMIF